MATVHLPRSLTDLFPDAPRRMALEAGTVAELIERLDEQWPGMRNRLCDAGPVLREHINVFVDGERAALDAPVRLHSEVHIIPAIAGGGVAPGTGSDPAPRAAGYDADARIS